MAQWQQSISFVEPAGLSSLVDGVGTLATAANATLDAGETALAAASALLAGPAAPQAAAAAALVTTAQALLNDVFGAGFFHLFAHPWQHGVGAGEGPWRHLPFPRCAQVIGESFDDLADQERPQFSSLAPVEMIVVITGAPSPTIFAQVLDGLNAIMDFREFRLAARRLAQALELEDQRFTISQGSRLPDWRSVTVREALPALAPVETAIKDALALLESYAAGGQAAVGIATDLIAAKRAQLTALQNNLAAASALFGQGIVGAGVYKVHISGTGGNDLLETQLLSATGGPGVELSFCAGVAWVGPEGTLTTLAGVLGL